ncbi:MAG TPA: stage II sporulation protein M [Cytophagales bacterium]|nr:stage II sporulation protein M [Cytophagales bacterium]
MRETSFIEQNKKKWKEFEEELASEHKDPDKLSNILIQVTDDLSFSRTFYPNRSVRVYLNNIAQQIFRNVYKNKSENRKKLWAFWKDDLPLLVYQCRNQLLVSLVIFTLSALIGVLSAIYDKDFPSLILGEDYIQMTLENIRKGDPLAVYKGSNQTDMFLGISLNNVMVAFKTFISGVFFAIGTLIIMVYNGIMIGTFQYFFYERGLFLDSFLTIWLHGTLEISSIIIAGASGLVLGRGLVFPGTYSRLQAFQISAKQGLKLFVSIVPILFFAAFIEGFITRYTEVPDALKALLILISFLFIFFYFVYYPYLKGKGQKVVIKSDGKLQVPKVHRIEIDTIKTNSEIFRDIFSFYQANFGKILIFFSPLSVVYTGVTYFLFKDVLNQNLFYFETVEKIYLFFNYQESTPVFVINSAVLFLNICLVNLFLIKYLNNDFKINLKVIFNLYKPLVLLVTFNSLLFLPIGLAILIMILVLPIVLLALFIGMIEESNLFKMVVRMFVLLHGNWAKMMLLHIMLALLSMIFLFLLASPVLYLLIEALKMFVYMDNAFYQTILSLIFIWSIVLGISLICPILTVGQALLYFSLKEINEATHLREMIAKLKVNSESKFNIE